MKILFKNVTKYSEEVYMDFLKFHTHTFGWKELLYNAFIIFFVICCIYTEIKIKEYLITGILIIGLVVFLIYKFYKPRKQVEKTWNSEQIQQEEVFEFDFYPSNFIISALNSKEAISIEYSDLYKIYDTPKYFYLYFDKEHSYIVNKSSFIKGSSTEFSNYFKKKYFYKYRQKNK